MDGITGGLVCRIELMVRVWFWEFWGMSVFYKGERD